MKNPCYDNRLSLTHTREVLIVEYNMTNNQETLKEINNLTNFLEVNELYEDNRRIYGIQSRMEIQRA